MHKYSVRVWSARRGDVITLWAVARAMARHAATDYGTAPFHDQSFQVFEEQRGSLLLAAARTGALKVCDSHGLVATVSELLDASEAVGEPAFTNPLLQLHVRSHHLIEWGKSNGDEFELIETPGWSSDTDLTNEAGDVLVSGYYRGSVGGGEFEPFPDDDALPLRVAVDEPLTTVLKPVSKSAAQQAEILAELKARGFDPMALPKSASGKPGVKAQVKLALGTKGLWAYKSVFKHAWDDLRKQGDIKDAS